MVLASLEAALALGLVGWIALDTCTMINALRALEAVGVSPHAGNVLPLGGWETAVMLAIAALGLVIIIAPQSLSLRRMQASA